MKKISIDRDVTKSIPSLLEVIHLCAEANGSKARMYATEIDSYNYFFNIAAPELKIPKGYLAVLYLIEQLDNPEIAYTHFEKLHSFGIVVKNQAVLIDYLMN